MLFNKDIVPCCMYCEHAQKINEEQALCKRHGVVSLTFKCRKYRYDATKRVPPEPEYIKSGTFSEKDFSY